MKLLAGLFEVDLRLLLRLPGVQPRGTKLPCQQADEHCEPSTVYSAIQPDIAKHIAVTPSASAPHHRQHTRMHALIRVRHFIATRHASANYLLTLRPIHLLLSTFNP